MSNVLLVAHHDRQEATALARQATTWLAGHGHRAWMTAADASALGVPELAAPLDPGDAALVISLGGDGTMLRTVQLLNGLPVPILGVNVGLLGYLTEIEPPNMQQALERWSAGPAAGHWHIEERMMIDAAVQTACGEANRTFTALNEAVVEKQESGHTVRLLVSIDGETFTSYAADGLIVATPTGSTAYSLSARGPVVSPQHRAMLLTPVSPHMLFDRSLVLDPDEAIDIEVLGQRTATLSIDGQTACTLHQGDRVSVRPSAATARFIRFGVRRFHQILKSKFGLADR